MDGLLSEILGNGEDHSPLNTYYVIGNSFIEFKNVSENNVVGEVNISIMNFGYSFYEGLEQTKVDNHENYRYLEQMYQRVQPHLKGSSITRENLFSLYALQPGVSRLRYQDESRGNGTMKFIESFFAFGDFEDVGKQYHPRMIILSGKTMITCNNTYRPFEIDGSKFISLNHEKTLKLPPDAANLKQLGTPYPGTILDIKIYINKDHLLTKFRDHQQN